MSRENRSGSIVVTSKGGFVRVRSMRQFAHKCLDHMVNESVGEGRRITGIAVIVRSRDDRGLDHTQTENTAECAHGIAASLDLAAFKAKLDLFEPN